MDPAKFYQALLNSDRSPRAFLRERVPEIARLESLDMLEDVKLRTVEARTPHLVHIVYAANLGAKYGLPTLLNDMNRHYPNDDVSVSKTDNRPNERQVWINLYDSPKKGRYLPPILLHVIVKRP